MSKLIIELEIDPSDWYDREEAIAEHGSWKAGIEWLIKQEGGWWNIDDLSDSKVVDIIIDGEQDE